MTRLAIRVAAVLVVIAAAIASVTAAEAHHRDKHSGGGGKALSEEPTSEADLWVSVEDDPDPYVDVLHSGVAYTITVGNDGEASADEVVVVDEMAGTILADIRYAGSEDNCTRIGEPWSNPETVQCDFGTIDPDEQRTVVVETTICYGTLIENGATVSSADDDSDTANNRASEMTVAIVLGTICPA